MSESLPGWNQNELTQLNEDNIIEYFWALLEDNEKKKKIIYEVANRILVCSPITHHDTWAIESWNPDYTTIDDIHFENMNYRKDIGFDLV